MSFCPPSESRNCRTLPKIERTDSPHPNRCAFSSFSGLIEIVNSKRICFCCCCCHLHKTMSQSYLHFNYFSLLFFLFPLDFCSISERNGSKLNWKAQKRRSKDAGRWKSKLLPKRLVYRVAKSEGKKSLESQNVSLSLSPGSVPSNTHASCQMWKLCDTLNLLPHSTNVRNTKATSRWGKKFNLRYFLSVNLFSSSCRFSDFCITFRIDIPPQRRGKGNESFRKWSSSINSLRFIFCNEINRIRDARDIPSVRGSYAIASLDGERKVYFYAEPAFARWTSEREKQFYYRPDMVRAARSN